MFMDHYKAVCPENSAQAAFLRVSNEPCVDRTKDIRRVLAHGWMDFGLDTYGECRDSHEPQSGEVTCRQS